MKWFVEVNFYLSVMALFSGGFLGFWDSVPIFEFNTDLYGPLANNLRMMLIYLALTEVFLCVGCFFSGNTKFFILIGISLVLISGSLKFYSVVNDIAVDPNLSIFFIYTGLSHLVFGLLTYMQKANQLDPISRFDQSP